MITLQDLDVNDPPKYCKLYESQSLASISRAIQRFQAEEAAGTAAVRKKRQQAHPECKPETPQKRRHTSAENASVNTQQHPNKTGLHAMGVAAAQAVPAAAEAAAAKEREQHNQQRVSRSNATCEATTLHDAPPPVSEPAAATAQPPSGMEAAAAALGQGLAQPADSSDDACFVGNFCNLFIHAFTSDLGALGLPNHQQQQQHAGQPKQQATSKGAKAAAAARKRGDGGSAEDDEASLLAAADAVSPELLLFCAEAAAAAWPPEQRGLLLHI